MSIDFDWFTSEQFEPYLLAENLRNNNIELNDIQVAPGTLHCVVNSVRVSFLKYSYPFLEQPYRFAEYPLFLASLDDLVCMKLAAITQRGSKKDFIDIFVLCVKYMSLTSMLELYKRKYSTNDIMHVLIGLSYFNDADNEPMPTLLSDLSGDKIKREIIYWVKNITK